MKRLVAALIVPLFCFFVAASALAEGEVWVRKTSKGIVFEYEGKQGGFGEIQKGLSSGFDVKRKDEEFRVFFEAEAPFSYVMSMRGTLMKIGYTNIRCYVYVRDTEMMMEIPWGESVPLPKH